MRIGTRFIHRLCQIKQNRNIIVPETFIKQPFDHYHLINSNNFAFLVQDNPPQNIFQIYEHFCDSPSNLLKKEAIHIFPKSMPQISIQQKYSAHLKKLMKRYEPAFNKCQTPAQLFHLERKAKSEIKHSCRFIGQIKDRYKHYNLFRSIDEERGRKTAEQYLKKGIKVSMLPFESEDKKIIYPKGQIWLPTNQDYLQLFSEYIENSKNLLDLKNGNILDVGCGSGVLSYILSHKLKSKNIKIFAIDSNPKAIETCQVNASALGLKNITAFQHDIMNKNDLVINFGKNKAPNSYDLIICNPPWIQAKKMKNESPILDGVYDEKGKFLSSLLQISGKLLANSNSRLILIYSDLSQILGLQKKSISDLCLQNNLLIHQKREIPYSKTFNKHSVLNPFKSKAKIQLFEIGRG